MVPLEPGHQYGLSSQTDFDENKSLIIVKLTDSAQRAIEEYLKNKDKISTRPTIQFVGNEGQLSFPSKSSHGNFQFSLSSNQDIEGPQGGFECIEQTEPGKLESLGALLCKMRIQANDDSFANTRNRMHAVEVNNKNKCTRVLKDNETVGKKVKVKGIVKAIPPTNHGSSPKNRDSSNFSSQSQLHKPNANSNRRSQMNNTQRKSPDVVSRSIKERLIHILALRPFTKSELYERLHPNGSPKQDKKSINNVLQQIAYERDDAYHLNISAWNDVQDDWPFYNDLEKTLLKRRKLQNGKTPPSSSNSSNSSGSRQSSPNSPGQAVNGVYTKRPSCDQGTENFPVKRQRISQIPFVREENQVPNIGLLDIGDGSDINATAPSLKHRSDNSATIQRNNNVESHSQYQHPSHLQQEEQNSDMPRTENNDVDSTVLSEESNSLNAIPTIDSNIPADDGNQTVNNTDYLTNFTTIKSMEQRSKYKAEFLSHFDEYRQLHAKSGSISSHFDLLGEKFRKNMQAGNIYAAEEIRQEIRQEYSRTKAIKARFDYMHRKLGHIQKLITEFDALQK